MINLLELDLEKLYEDSSDPSLEGTQLCPGEKGPAGDWQLGSELYHSILAPRQGETSSKLMFASELALYRAGKIEWRGASSEAVGKTTSGLAADGLLYEAQLEEKQLKTNEAIDMHGKANAEHGDVNLSPHSDSLFGAYKFRERSVKH
ncbi:unnamed protein product [Protopolystoma xenopodis]|uniref:Uncharacterized protein n=1 Tax=Protopolystoma xenopodis TaxID=117903 RepID=A0A448X360_9PLAT|nr:unnamed protein product [Protopolystoma xenopodis]